MAEYDLNYISKRMRQLDICMMSTITENGEIISRPMSNNGDVEYDGNSYFFTYEDTELVDDLKQNDKLNLSFTGNDKFYISITCEGVIIQDKEVMKKHWVEELNAWFKEGINTPGITLIHAKANRIKFWHNEEECEVKM